jgi:hypothetical protein
VMPRRGAGGGMWTRPQRARSRPGRGRRRGGPRGLRGWPGVSGRRRGRRRPGTSVVDARASAGSARSASVPTDSRTAFAISGSGEGGQSPRGARHAGKQQVGAREIARPEQGQRGTPAHRGADGHCVVHEGTSGDLGCLPRAARQHCQGHPDADCPRRALAVRQVREHVGGGAHITGEGEGLGVAYPEGRHVTPGLDGCGVQARGSTRVSRDLACGLLGQRVCHSRVAQAELGEVPGNLLQVRPGAGEVVHELGQHLPDPVWGPGADQRLAHQHGHDSVRADEAAVPQAVHDPTYLEGVEAAKGGEAAGPPWLGYPAASDRRTSASRSGTSRRSRRTWRSATGPPLGVGPPPGPGRPAAVVSAAASTVSTTSHGRAAVATTMSPGVLGEPGCSANSAATSASLQASSTTVRVPRVDAGSAPVPLAPAPGRVAATRRPSPSSTLRSSSSRLSAGSRCASSSRCSRGGRVLTGGERRGWVKRGANPADGQAPHHGRGPRWRAGRWTSLHPGRRRGAGAPVRRARAPTQPRPPPSPRSGRCRHSRGATAPLRLRPVARALVGQGESRGRHVGQGVRGRSGVTRGLVGTGVVDRVRRGVRVRIGRGVGRGVRIGRGGPEWGQARGSGSGVGSGVGS